METWIEKIHKMFNKDLEELKYKHTEMSNTITEMEYTLEGINNRITFAEERISELEDRMVEITADEQHKEKRIEGNATDLWDNTKCTNIRIIGIPEEEKKKGSEKIFEEIRIENFPNMGRGRVNRLQEVQSIPYRLNPKTNMPRHILIKLTN